MSRKDYELIAREIKSALEKADNRDDVRLGIWYAATNLSYALRETNPRFDRERFLNACGF